MPLVSRLVRDAGPRARAYLEEIVQANTAPRFVQVRIIAAFASAGIPPADPATFLVAAVLCLLTTIGGSLAPSLRALRVDAIAALRSG